jgi:hypothetical protein
MRTKFWQGNPREEKLGNLGVDVRIILEMGFKGGGWESVDWIHLDQDRDHWRVLVNRIMNLRDP